MKIINVEKVKELRGYNEPTFQFNLGYREACNEVLSTAYEITEEDIKKIIIDLAFKKSTTQFVLAEADEYAQAILSLLEEKQNEKI